MRICKRCGKEKPLDQFSGTKHQCGPCLANNARLRRLGVRVPKISVGDVVAAAESPRVRDLEWAAGFLEGEGTFVAGGRYITVSAVQVVREPLARLQRLFGGSLRPRIPQVMNNGYIPKPQVMWAVNGVRARGVMQTLYPLLSSKRKRQIMGALQKNGWRSRAAAA